MNRLSPHTFGCQRSGIGKQINKTIPMKTTMLLALSLAAFIAFTTHPTQAQEGGGGHSHFTKIPATVDEIWRYAEICRVARVIYPYLESLE